MRKYVIILLLFINLYMIADASDWFEIDNKTYIDLDTIKRSGNITSIWVKFLNNGGSDWKKNEWYSMQKVFYYCTKNQYSISSSHLYDIHGDLIGSKQYKYYEWIDIVPQTKGEGIYATVCGE